MQPLSLSSLIVMLSALLLALLCVLPQFRDVPLLGVIRLGADMMDTFFHELGHTVFGWLLGVPSIPSIMTLFGADQAAGFTLAFTRHWWLQVVAFAVMGYGCYWVYYHFRGFFYPAVAFALAMAGVACFGNYRVVIFYMGHGGAIAMGAFFLFRAWLYLDARNAFERWLNAFFGFFLTLKNMYFSALLVMSADFNEEYSSRLIGGVSHNDFMAMTQQMPGWTVKGIAECTMVYGLAAMLGAFLLALFASRPGSHLLD